MRPEKTSELRHKQPNAERCKHQRELIKADPELYALHKKRDAERSKQRRLQTTPEQKEREKKMPDVDHKPIGNFFSHKYTIYILF